MWRRVKASQSSHSPFSSVNAVNSVLNVDFVQTKGFFCKPWFRLGCATWFFADLYCLLRLIVTGGGGQVASSRTGGAALRIVATWMCGVVFCQPPRQWFANVLKVTLEVFPSCFPFLLELTFFLCGVNDHPSWWKGLKTHFPKYFSHFFLSLVSQQGVVTKRMIMHFDKKYQVGWTRSVVRCVVGCIVDWLVGCLLSWSFLQTRSLALASQAPDGILVTSIPIQ